MEKTKVEELMIKDYVFYKSDSPQNSFPVQINNLKYLDDISKFPERYDFVLLTSEILEKNGWEFSYNDFFKHPSSEFIICWIGKVWSLEVGTLELGYHSFADINYIHELQHALRLCGLNEMADSMVI